MDSFTREEEACLKTALALVVVRKRLQQKQQKQQQQAQENDGLQTISAKYNSATNDDASSSSKRHSSAYPNMELKKICTMESIVFPWATAATASSSSSVSRVAEGSGGCNKAPVPSLPSAQELCQSQKDHLQSMMVTAIRMAMRLIHSTPRDNSPTTTTTNSNVHDSSSQEWSTLSAFTAHIAHQLSFSASLSGTQTKSTHEKNRTRAAASSSLASSSLPSIPCTAVAKEKTTANKKAAPKNANANPTIVTHNDKKIDKEQDDWIRTWIYTNLKDLTVPTSTTTTQPSKEDASLMSAAFLVWRGILLGGYNLAADPNNPNDQGMAMADTKKPATGSTTSPSMDHQKLQICRGLFLEAFCDILQTTKILEEGPLGDVQGTDPSDHPSGGPAWKRLFSHRHRHPSSYRPATPAQKELQKRQQHMLDLWVVHGLQLVEQVTAAPSSAAHVVVEPIYHHHHHHGPTTRSSQSTISGVSCSSGGPSISVPPPPPSMILHERIPPESCLPPTDLVQWYVELMADRQEREQKAIPPLAGTSTAAPAPVLDPGAKLMTMVALYQALQNEESGMDKVYGAK